ncbi:MAG: hypothetical protein K8R92_00795 [Planctomycetes bacterium]|nr:hypothetical protein [Planctomycetota bacterium]
MSEARINQQWDHTASLMAVLAEINRNNEERKQPFTMMDFHPKHLQQRPVEKPTISMAALKALVCPQKKP